MSGPKACGTGMDTLSRSAWIAGSLLGAGVAGLVALVAIWSAQPPPGPTGDGELGSVRLFVQTEKGPMGVVPNTPEFPVPRPQDFVFQFYCKGSGPREIRIELETERGTATLYDQVLDAPYQDTLLLEQFGESDPDHLKILVTVEAPHLPVLHTQYEIQLAGPNRDFRTPPTDAGAAD